MQTKRPGIADAPEIPPGAKLIPPQGGSGTAPAFPPIAVPTVRRKVGHREIGPLPPLPTREVLETLEWCAKLAERFERPDIAEAIRIGPAPTRPTAEPPIPQAPSGI